MTTAQLQQASQQRERECRICRSEEGELFYPCACSGSMRFIHESCLVEWLAITGKRSCEVCGMEFMFREEFREDAPPALSDAQVLLGALQQQAAFLLPAVSPARVPELLCRVVLVCTFVEQMTEQVDGLLGNSSSFTEMVVSSTDVIANAWGMGLGICLVLFVLLFAMTLFRGFPLEGENPFEEGGEENNGIQENILDNNLAPPPPQQPLLNIHDVPNEQQPQQQQGWINWVVNLFLQNGPNPEREQPQQHNAEANIPLRVFLGWEGNPMIAIQTLTGLIVFNFFLLFVFQLIPFCIGRLIMHFFGDFAMAYFAIYDFFLELSSSKLISENSHLLASQAGISSRSSSEGDSLLSLDHNSTNSNSSTTENEPHLVADLLIMAFGYDALICIFLIQSLFSRIFVLIRLVPVIFCTGLVIFIEYAASFMIIGYVVNLATIELSYDPATEFTRRQGACELYPLACVGTLWFIAFGFQAFLLSSLDTLQPLFHSHLFPENPNPENRAEDGGVSSYFFHSPVAVYKALKNATQNGGFFRTFIQLCSLPVLRILFCIVVAFSAVALPLHLVHNYIPWILPLQLGLFEKPLSGKTTFLTSFDFLLIHLLLPWIVEEFPVELYFQSIFTSLPFLICKILDLDGLIRASPQEMGLRIQDGIEMVASLRATGSSVEISSNVEEMRNNSDAIQKMTQASVGDELDILVLAIAVVSPTERCSPQNQALFLQSKDASLGTELILLDEANIAFSLFLKDFNAFEASGAESEKKNLSIRSPSNLSFDIMRRRCSEFLVDTSFSQGEHAPRFSEQFSKCTSSSQVLGFLAQFFWKFEGRISSGDLKRCCLPGGVANGILTDKTNELTNLSVLSFLVEEVYTKKKIIPVLFRGVRVSQKERGRSLEFDLKTSSLLIYPLSSPAKVQSLLNFAVSHSPNRTNERVPPRRNSKISYFRFVPKSYLGLRITAFALLVLFICVPISSIATLGLPLVVGRLLLWVFSPECNDLHHFVVGVAFLVAGVPVFLKSNRRDLLRLLLYGFTFVLVIPLLAGVVFETAILFPIRVPLDMTPRYSFSQDLMIGYPCAKIWRTTVQILDAGDFGGFEIVTRFARMQREGILNFEPMWVLQNIAAPMIRFLLLCLAIPICFGEIMGLIFGEGHHLSAFFSRYASLCCLVLVLIRWLLHVLHDTIIVGMHDQIYERKYLIGRRLRNKT